MVKDLSESSHKPNESARTKKFPTYKGHYYVHRHPPLDRIPSQFIPFTSFTQ